MSQAKDLSHQKNRGILQNLISVMVADCRIDPAETRFLEKMCQRMGISREELADVFLNLGMIKEYVPDQPQERIAQLLDMVFMMMVDGHIDDREVDVCKLAAQRFGFDAAVIDTIIESLEQGKEREEIGRLLQASV